MEPPLTYEARAKKPIVPGVTKDPIKNGIVAYQYSVLPKSLE